MLGATAVKDVLGATITERSDHTNMVARISCYHNGWCAMRYGAKTVAPVATTGPLAFDPASRIQITLTERSFEDMLIPRLGP